MVNKKKNPVSIQRNILASPYDKFWPLLRDNDCTELQSLLQKFLPLAAKPKGFLARKKLKQIFREKDKSKRKNMWKEKEKSINSVQKESAKLYRKSLILGVNCVTRGIEKSQVAACLIAGDVSSRFLVSHVIAMAAQAGVIVLVMPSLKETTRISLGVPCLALAFKEEVKNKEDNVFYQIYEIIVELSKRFIVPDHLFVNQASSADESGSKEDSADDKSEVCTEIMTDIDLRKPCASSTFSYLFRTSEKRRVFIPPPPDVEMENSDLTFIPIGIDDSFNNDLSQNERHKNVENLLGDSFEEEDDDDDDDNNDNGSVNNDFLAECDSTFFVDTKPVVKQNVKDTKKINLKSTVVKKVRGNPKKKRKKH